MSTNTEKPKETPVKSPNAAVAAAENQAPSRRRIPFGGFVDFIREQGVVGLAIGFILGGSVTKVVSSLVSDIINPVLSVVLGAAGNLKDMYLQAGPVKISWGNFASNLIDFIVIASVVYFGVKIIGLNKLDKKKGN